MENALAATLREVLRGAPRKQQSDQRDHRAATRYAMRARVTVCPVSGDDNRPDGRPEKVWLRDVSCSGVGFLHNKPVRIGQVFLLDVPDLEDLCPLRCAVVRCERMPGDGYVIGASYTVAPGTPVAISAGQPGAPAGGGRSTTSTSVAVTRLTAHVAARTKVDAKADPVAALTEHVKRAAGESPSPTALLGLDARILWANGALGRLLGATPDSFVGRPITSLSHADDASEAAAAAARSARTTARRQFAHRDGSAVAVDLSANTLRDASGRPLLVLMIAEPARETPPTAPPPAAAAREASPPTLTADSFAPHEPEPADDADEVDRIRRAMLG